MHFLRDCLGHARKDQHGLLAALIRPVYGAESGEQARERLAEAISQRPLPKAARMLEEAEEDVLAFYAFPGEHSGASCARLIRSSASTARSAGRTDVIGILPDDPSLIRLTSMLAIEANDEWLVGRAT